VPDAKWSEVTVDMITDLPTSTRGFDAILVFVDRFTKMVHLVPTTKTMDSAEFCHLFAANVIRLHGVPDRLISDRGSVFTSNYTRVWQATMGTWQNFSSAYHPESDGQTERANRVIEDVLRSFTATDVSGWDRCLPMVEFAMNNAPNDTTKQTPFVLNYGINPRHPAVARLVSRHIAVPPPPTANARQEQLTAVYAMASAFRALPDVPAATDFSVAMREAVKRAKLLLEAGRSRMKAITDPRRTTTITIKAGDRVMLSTKNIKLQLGHACHKLVPRFVGPFTVASAVGPVAFRLEPPPTMRIHNVFHASLLQPYRHRQGDTEPHPAPLVVNDEEEYEVEALLDKREKIKAKHRRKHRSTTRSITQYLVKWHGYGPEHNEWVDEPELRRHCQDLLRAYDASH